MIGKFRLALGNVLGSDLPGPKYPYSRPGFLSLRSQDEIQVASDVSVRPIIVPKAPLPQGSGYAEAVNAGKSKRNEDQAVAIQASVGSVPYTYFGIFDGHAGPDTAIAASKELQGILAGHLSEIFEGREDSGKEARPSPSLDSLIIGALEASFIDMDASIGVDKVAHSLPGGCTALVALFIRGKLYVANAGDSRALLVRKEGVYPMSYDFTPISERQRLQRLGKLRPELLGDEFSRLDYHKRPLTQDIGSKALYRDAHMTGWATKVITESDLKVPLVYGEGKRSRLLATIGVTRGFGDHDLSFRGSHLLIKPFLSPEPEVRVFDLSKASSEDVLILGTDGLWDVVANEAVGEVVRNGLSLPSVEERYSFVSIAQELVMRARGKFVDYAWTQGADNSPATIDDISVFVIPLLPRLAHKNNKRAEDKTSSESVS